MHELVKLMAGTITWSLEYNHHKGLYQSIGDWAEYMSIDADENDLADINACVDAGNVWHLQVYPRTPIGFYRIFAPTFDALLERARALSEQMAPELLLG